MRTCVRARPRIHEAERERRSRRRALDRGAPAPRACGPPAATTHAPAVRATSGASRPPTSIPTRRARRRASQGAQPLEDILVERLDLQPRHLKQRLYAEGLKQRRCELCGQGEDWRGRRMSLILDHINGVATTTGSRTCRSCARTARRRSTRIAGANRPHVGGATCRNCGAVSSGVARQQRYCSRRVRDAVRRRGASACGAAAGRAAAV